MLSLLAWQLIKLLCCIATGGLTENDFILAAKINNLNVEHLLRKKAAD